MHTHTHTVNTFVDLVLGPDSYRAIAQYLEKIVKEKTKIIDTDFKPENYTDICPMRAGITDFVPIMRGCDNYCSYCIVPYVRGMPRSRPLRDIVHEVETLVNAGVKDITLLGQNVNEYIFEEFDFADLLNRVAQVKGLFRLRFLTSHPKDLNTKIIDAVKNNPNICEWFHLPVQAGSNRILGLMNRKYTKERYLSLVREIKTSIPEAGITTDIIAGFPTETDDEFEQTIALVNQCQFDDAYTYRYSVRPGTKASHYESLPESVIKERLQRLIKIQNQITFDKTKAMIGKTYEVLFESRARFNGTRGKTRANKDVVVDEFIDPDTIRNVEICAVRGRTPIGKIIG